MVSQRLSPVVETLIWPPAASRTTNEQVASKLMPATVSGETFAAASASRTAPQTAVQMSCESCSA